MLIIACICCICRTATARGKAEQADIAAVHAREDAQLAIGVSKAFGGNTNATAEEKLTATETTTGQAASNLLTVKNHNNAAASVATAKANAATSLPSK